MLIKNISGLLVLVSQRAGACHASIQQWQSTSGAKVLFVENHDIPMLEWRSAFRGQQFRYAEKSGVAGLAHHLLDLGADGLSETMSRAACGHRRAVRWQLRSGQGRRVAAHAEQRAERDRALDIMARVLQRPLFRRTFWCAKKRA